MQSWKQMISPSGRPFEPLIGLPNPQGLFGLVAVQAFHSAQHFDWTQVWQTSLGSCAAQVVPGVLPSEPPSLGSQV